ncbi:RHS repeat domain-containing protein [Shewanella sp. UCD-KL21]|uniref:RHS repeat domain-containing protein n=1 Tax=Shewanella sp. UCD-KL21 TaxID=1917164 RepID=UPI000971142A|nr:RHS repeat protein [Shewanella sp. UCD-KL21]
MDIVLTRTHFRDKFTFGLPYIAVENVPASSNPIFNSACLGEYQRLNVGENSKSFNAVGFDLITDLPASTIAVFSNYSALTCEGEVPVLNLFDGKKYKFTKVRSVSGQYSKQDLWYVETIEDRFGNKISYQYENEASPPEYNHPKRLKSIKRNDGEVVDLYYKPVVNSRDGKFEELSEIHFSGKIIKYEYTTGRLDSFIDAEGRKTLFTYSLNSAPVGWQISTITTPENLKVEYRYRVTGTPAFISGRFSEEANPPSATLAWKKITGPGISERYYRYDKKFGPTGYAKTLIFYLDHSGSKDLTTEFTFKTKRNDTSSGQLTKIKRFEGEFFQGGQGYKTQYSSHSLVYEKSFTWVKRNSNEIGCPASTRHINDSYALLDCGRHVISKHELKIRNGDQFDTFTTKTISFDKYDSPKITHEFATYNNSITYQKYVKNLYLHNKNNWILNLPTKTYLSSSQFFGTPRDEIIYNSNNLPYQEKKFGEVLKTFTYQPNGEVLNISYHGTNKYVKYEDYYLGIARKITHPCAITNGCNTANGSTINTIIKKLEVNRDSTIKSESDFNGNKINYSYNLLGWLTKIDYTDTKWKDMVTRYSTVITDEDGIAGSGVEVGSLKETTTHGNYEIQNYFDSLGQIIFSSEQDKSDFSTVRYKAYKYNVHGLNTLETFPSDIANNKKGVETQYDALGRIISQTRNSDSSIRQRKYLSGNKIAVTDSENNTTTTSFLAYGKPTYDKPNLIVAPDTDDTVINYNIFDQIISTRQGNIIETRIYDDSQKLCKQVRPETGIAVFGYNAQRLPIWLAEGTSGSITSCDEGVVPASHKILLGYDNLGQLHTENYPDSTPDKTYSYDANGNLVSLTSGSAAIRWSYLYNSFNLVEKETLSIDNKNFVLDWTYNSLGAVSSLKYPSGRAVDFLPNALGQPTKASEGSASATVHYASNIKYHPNGQLKQMKYGNGIIRDISLDTSGRIDSIKDLIHGSRRRLSLDPSYDKNDNLTGLIDWRDRSNDIGNMSYDGLDRLKSANGKWGQGNYTYDGLGNIKTRSINGSSMTYHYNSVNRLNNLTGAYAYTYNYDSRGNVTHNGRYGLSLNRANQVTSAKGIPYRYDGHNRRVKKTDDYSVYSHSGQLLYRQKANGEKTDSVYVGKQVIAEIDLTGGYVPPTPPIPEPSLYLYFVGGKPPVDDCPKGFVCESVSPLIPSTNDYVLSWRTSNVDSCSGIVLRNGSPNKTLSGTSNTGINFTYDDAVYEARLTCVGAGGTVTKSAIVGGTGDEY